MTVRVLIVDDHSVLVQTLALALGTAEGIEVAGTASTATEAETEAARLNPDVALVDVNLPDGDGIQLAKRFKRISPTTRVVMLTGNLDPVHFANAMAAGASGYLLKDSGLTEVLDAVRRASGGEVVVPERVAGLVSAPQAAAPVRLTPREMDVLRLMGAGSDQRTISKALGITWQTTRSYVKNVLSKLDAHSQLEAVAKARRLGLLVDQEG